MSKAIIASVLGLGLAAVGATALWVQAPLPVLADTEETSSAEFALPIASVLEGKASWYGPYFHGRLTASGEIYNRYALTAAHRTLRHGTVVRVTNLENDLSAVLVINDWGPVPKDRIIDVSEAAADVLGFRHQGLVQVRVEVYRAALDSR
ncbi:MAG: septal ring lytic transglycosylase RlpA family protein [Acidobacteria bacterium]|nr:septal ring lytic transglycosylase RlpA family protein [Acidobacteriota bacterium]